MVAASARVLRRSRPAIERVALGRAAGRILARPLVADCDQPPFARSTRDGYACRAAEASTHSPLTLAGAARAGDSPSGPLPPGAAWEIMTGAPVPTGADAVLMLEHVEVEGENLRLLPSRTLKPGENIVAQGAQASAGDEMLPAGSALGFGQIALAAGSGPAAQAWFLRPPVGHLPTGDELVPVEASPAPGQIRNSNAPMLAALVAAAGGEPWVLPAAADNAQALDAALAEAVDADLLLISGGVSAGKFDLVEPALARIGADFHFTGARIQPGKPVVFGELPRGAGSATLPFFGLPGNPVSSAVTFLLFAAPILVALAGSRESPPRLALARMDSPLGFDRLGKPGLTRFLPARCDFGAGAAQLPRVALVPMHGSGDLGALARCNCFLVAPEEARGSAPDAHSSGSIVRILLF